jgi:hypothetical protein
MDDATEPNPVPPEPASGFEALLWDLFLRLMDVPGDRLEAEFLDAQRRMCRSLELDRSALWQTRVDNPGGLFVTHVFDVDQDQAGPARSWRTSSSTSRGARWRSTWSRRPRRPPRWRT